MKKKLLVSFGLMICLVNSYSQTTISGGAVSGNWTKQNSPYLIEGAIMIADGTSLSIEPGVQVEFQGSYKFLVLGQLLAKGSAEDSITFTASDTTNGWLGIRFENTPSTNDSSIFLYCRLTYGKATASSPYNSGGAFYIEQFSKVRISYSRLSHCSASRSGAAIACMGSNPKISNNLFFKNIGFTTGAIYFNSFGVGPTIINNTFLKNHTSSQGGAIGCLGGGAIKNNIFISNSSNAQSEYKGGGSIYIGMGSNTTISANVFVNNSCSKWGGGAICIEGSDEVTLLNNVFTNNSAMKGGAIYCFQGSPTFENNTFSNNNAVSGGALFFTQNSSSNISNTIMWGNTAGSINNQVHLDDESSDPNFYYCDIQGGQSGISIVENAFHLGDYINNLDTDPEFISPTAGSGLDYNGLNAYLYIRSSSPCINAGNPAGTISDYDVAGYPRVVMDTIDIGAYEYSDDITEIIENQEVSLLTIYPNPTPDKFTVHFIGDNIYAIEIYNSIGVRIYSASNLNTDAPVTIDISETIAGTYFIKIYGDYKVYFRTIVKH